MNDQAYALRDGAEIIIATPGRLKDCIERHVLVLSQCTYVVMDEADKMVDMGFEPQVNFILDSLPVSNLKPDSNVAEDLGQDAVGRYRVTMLYSATMPPSVERMARVYLRRPATITIGNAGQAVASVEQIVEFVPPKNRGRSRLIAILQRSPHLVPIIVFVNQKKAADQLSSFLTRQGFYISTLHSGKSQECVKKPWPTFEMVQPNPGRNRSGRKRYRRPQCGSRRQLCDAQQHRSVHS